MEKWNSILYNTSPCGDSLWKREKLLTFQWFLMKKILLILLTIIIIWWISLIKYFIVENKLDIENIKKSIVIIIPENQLISYRNNPKWIIEDYKESGIWVWFIIDNFWTIQTVNHLVENDKINYKVIYNNIEYEVISFSRDEKADLAKLKIKLDYKGTIPFLKKWNSADSHEIYSFWVNTNNLEIIYNTWIILNQKSKLDNMPNLLEISNDLKPGFSWGPIINSKGNVIWINYAISQWKNYAIIFK